MLCGGQRHQDRLGIKNNRKQAAEKHKSAVGSGCFGPKTETCSFILQANWLLAVLEWRWHDGGQAHPE